MTYRKSSDLYCCLADLDQEGFRQRVTEFAA